MPSTTANSSSFSSSSMTSPLVEEEMSAEERSLVEDDATSNRSHSICVVPSDFSTSSSQEPHSKDSNNHAHPSPEATKKTALPEIKILDLGGNDKNSNLKVHDSGLEATAASHRVSSEDINLTCRQISKDKTEGLAHLDPHSILQNPVHEELLRGHSHAHLNVQPSPPITRPPTSILRDPSGSGSQHGSFFELKHLQHAGRYANGGVPGSGVELASGLTIDGGKRAFFETGPPKRQTWATQQDPNLDPVDGIVSLLSAIYCKIIVVIGLCFPMAEVISHRIPISWYEGFYLYLYTGSILFLIFVYIFLLNRKGKPGTFARAKIGLFRLCRRMTRRKRRTASSGSPKKGGEDEDTEQSSSTASFEDSEEADEEDFQQIQCGSFYLRVGAVAFGVGSMIYSGLEFGQFFELESKEHCYSFMYGLTPGSHMIFTFIQLYFIFMNSRVIIARHKLIARFGLMHMIGTNICVWLHVLIQETKHQIMTMVETNSTELGSVDLSHAWDHVDDVVEEMSEDYIDSISSHPLPHPHTNRNTLPPGGGSSHASIVALVNSTLFPSTTTEPSLTTSGHASILPGLHRSVRSLNDHYITHSDCRRSNIIGELVSDSSQFLFPCTIEYSLICAAILYIMWKSISDMRRKPIAMCPISKQPTTLVHHQKHHYQVDCAKAHKGLFTGIFLMVICIISLILFFVFIKKDQYRNLAVLQAHIVELVIYCINAIACLIALFQVRELNYNRNRGVELDNILLIIAQSGLCIFTMFSIIGAQFISQLQNTRLVLINAFACLIQSTLQSVFILDASKRKASTADQVRRKPGREMVTFLLVCNFSMWAINTLETRRAESNPVQMSFYGFWAWTIITHVTMPLTIFYRFHSTVCLCEIWKGTYKIKSEYL